VSSDLAAREMKRAAPDEAGGEDGVAAPAADPPRAPLSPSRAGANSNPPRGPPAAFKPRPVMRGAGFRPPGGVNPSAGFKSPFVRPGGAGAAPPARPPTRPAFAAPKRSAPPGTAASTSAPPPPASKSYFSCLYAKRKSAKNRSSKTWLDGVVLTVPPVTTLFDDAGKPVAKAKAGTCVAGTTMEIGNWEVEIQDPVAESAFLSGAALSGGGGGGGAVASASTATAAPFSKPFANAKTNKTNAAGLGSQTPSSSRESRATCERTPGGRVCFIARRRCLSGPSGAGEIARVCGRVFSGRAAPAPARGRLVHVRGRLGLRRDAHTGAPHFGCLLAHEMGMGKTLQVIALLWTLLKQGPSGSPFARKAVVVCPASLVRNWGAEFRKWLGSTRLEPLLVESGAGEKGKDAKTLFEDWALPQQKRWRVLVTSFETLRAHAETVASATGGIDLLVCDEAHRLKNAKGDTQTVAALRKLRCKKRVLLSGTPVQNDLGELFAVFDFACPGVLGDLAQFRKVFAAPVERSRDKNASDEERALGAARGEELGRMTAPFVHRASALEVNRHRLPPKTEYVVFCRLAETQASMYAAYLRECSRAVFGGGSGGVAPLQALQNLQRLCTSATLLMRDAAGDESDETRDGGEELTAPSVKKPLMKLDEATRERLASRLPAGHPDPRDGSVPAHHPAMSGKLAVLTSLLASLNSHAEKKSGRERDRTVVVSGWTSTLDVIAAACAAAGVAKTSRLDGSVPPHRRQALVDAFNAGRGGDVFLLSTKAGGVGLNLVGANRLVLFDSDWNPANDLQALARVWREGQQRPVTIYRLLSAGTVEEKVFQRQILKGAVANAAGYVGASADASSGEYNVAGALTGSGTNPNAFSKEELRDLFAFDPGATCDTAETLRRRGESCSLSDAREIPEHWRRCASEAEGGVADAPLKAATALDVWTSAETEGTERKTKRKRLVSFVCALPSSAAAPPPSETTAT
jgi:superfamily II DNA or RNA helicase